MSGQELAVQDRQAELMAGGGLGFEDTYIKPTNITLVQRTTTNKDSIPGKLFDELTLTNLDSVELVPLKIFRGRALFPEGGNLGSKPICRSDDGVAPSKFAEFPQADLCNRCPKGSWQDYDRKTGKGKPTCKEKWNVLCINKETGLPRRIVVGGTSLTPFKKLLEQLNQDAQMAKAKGEPKRNLFDYTFTLSSECIVGAKGTYYVAKFTNVKRVLDSSEYGPMYMQYVESARAKREAAEAVEAVADAVSEVVEGETEVAV